VKSTTSSPATVLMSWCRLTTLLPVMPSTKVSRPASPSPSAASAPA
jgi:hypothetical protein